MLVLLYAFRVLWKELGDSNFKIFFTELAVPPQAAGVVGTAGVCLCGVCSRVSVLRLSVRLSWYPM